MSLRNVAKRVVGLDDGFKRGLDALDANVAHLLKEAAENGSLARKGLGALPDGAKKDLVDSMAHIISHVEDQAARRSIMSEYAQSVLPHFEQAGMGREQFAQHMTSFGEDVASRVKEIQETEKLRKATTDLAQANPARTPEPSYATYRAAPEPAAPTGGATPPPKKPDEPVDAHFEEPGKDPHPNADDDFEHFDVDGRDRNNGGSPKSNPQSPNPASPFAKVAKELNDMRRSSFWARLDPSDGHNLGAFDQSDLNHTARVLAGARTDNTAKAKDLFKFLDWNQDSEAYLSLPLKGAEGKALSPVSTLDALSNGYRVTPESLNRLGDYLSDNHYSRGAKSNTIVENAKFVGAPFRAANVLFDARSSSSMRIGTVSALALTLGGIGSYGLNTYNDFANPTLGSTLAVPPTYFIEPFDQYFSSQDDLPAQADWEVVKANRNRDWSDKLIVEAGKTDGQRLSTVPQTVAGTHLKKTVTVAATEADTAISAAQGSKAAALNEQLENAAPLAGTNAARISTGAILGGGSSNAIGTNAADISSRPDIPAELNRMRSSQYLTDSEYAKLKNAWDQEMLQSDPMKQKLSDFKTQAADILTKSGRAPDVAKYMVAEEMRLGM